MPSDIPEPTEPRLRRPLGVLIFIAYLAVYALVAAVLFGFVNQWHALAQLPVWLVLGLAWLIPVKPFLRWMETGRWR